MKSLQDCARERILIIDGAMGTMIQRYQLQEADANQPEVFKVCFLNKYEMQRWKELQQQNESETNHTIFADRSVKDAV